MKARREARLKAPGPAHTDASPQSFFTTPSPQRRPPGPSVTGVGFPPVNRADTEEDFVTPLDASVPHPMPRSIDNGATLDWSGKEVVEEPRHDRRWSLSITKRRTKDKVTSIPSLDHSPLDVSHESDYDGLFHCPNSQMWPLIVQPRPCDQHTGAYGATDVAKGFRSCRTCSTPLLIPICIVASSVASA